LAITDYDGNVLEENLPELKDLFPSNCAQNDRLLQEPVRDGTASKAKELKRHCG